MSGTGAFYMVAACAVVLVGFSRGTPLDDYVKKPDPTYQFRDLEKPVKMDGYTVHYLNMTSQTWLSSDLVSCSVWWHILVVTIPDNVIFPDTAMVYVTGGSNHAGDSLPEVTDEDILFSSTVAFTTGVISATLFQIPNQPCVFSEDTVMNHKSRTEDAIIAFTWYHFLLHPDQPEYLLRLPMTKAVVRAMDTISAFVQLKNSSLSIKKFAVAGASKRGWTTWTTSVVDDRVIAMVPIVEDALNLRANLHHMYRAYGGWTFAFKDYIDLNFTSYIDDPAFQNMTDIIDPYVYRERMTMPKLIIDAGGDEFFLPDDNHYFWDDLPEPKYLRMVPNAEHSLFNKVVTLVLGIRAFLLSVMTNNYVEGMKWTMESNDDEGTILFNSETQPTDVRVFYATTLSSERRDFRWLTGPDPDHPTVQPVLWFNNKLTPEANGSYIARVSAPSSGWTAFFIQAYFDGPDQSVHELTTQVNIVPDKFPFPACSGKSCKGKLV